LFVYFGHGCDLAEMSAPLFETQPKDFLVSRISEQRKRVFLTSDESRIMKRIHFLIGGIVQGVGFRYYVINHARRLKVKGFVKNLDDGRVEVVAEGDSRRLEELEKLLRKGPYGSKVEDVKIFTEQYKNEFKDFDVVF
jgi:acylphosphatase